MYRSIYLQQKAYEYTDHVHIHTDWPYMFVFITGGMLYSMLDSRNQGHMAPRGRGPHWSRARNCTWPLGTCKKATMDTHDMAGMNTYQWIDGAAHAVHIHT